MLRIIILVAPALIATTALAHAANVTVYQENRKFSEAEVAVKPGDTVTFSNKDAYTHNVFSSTPGMAFDLKTQKSGESTEVKFETAGEAEVQCAIHPQMKLKVKVHP
jgi:plastocyanin